MRILLIDDDTQTVEMIRGYLSQLGHLVMTVSDGMAGIQLCNLYQFDLVICDLNMPIMNGFDFLDETKAIRVHKGTRIVILSSETNEIMALKARQMGAAEFWVKPPNLYILGQLLERFSKVYCLEE
ncbi:MAG: response regulator [Methylocystaceae bacterium]